MSGSILERLRGGLIVSVQAKPGSALDDPAVLRALALAAKAGGAAGLRMAGGRNLKAVRDLDLPIVGIVKREYDGFEPYITPTLREVQEIVGCGAQIVAFDATRRTRPENTSTADLVEAIHRAGALAMADCAQAEDGAAAARAGAEILATTLCGYTKETAGQALPALGLVRALRAQQAFVICEGGVHSPGEGAAAMAAGADAVVVGTAITNVEWLTQRYAQALQRSSRP